MTLARNILIVVAALTDASGLHAQTTLSTERLQRLRAELPGMTDACAAKIKAGGLEAIPHRVDQCFKMMPQRHWRGLWWQGFEHSRFCPAPARTCDDKRAGEAIWLDFKDKAAEPRAAAFSGLFTIEFVGRRTLRRGTHGHLGLSPYEILVDRLIFIKRLRADPR